MILQHFRHPRREMRFQNQGRKNLQAKKSKGLFQFMIQKNVYREREEDFNYRSAGYKQRAQTNL